MPDPAQDRDPRGLYLQIYHSALVQASRMAKIGRAVQDSGHFRETHLVGVGEPGDPPEEELGDGLRIVRLTARKFGLGHLGRVRRVATWYAGVLGRYGRAPVAMVAAHSVWVLPLSWLLARRTGAVLIYNCHELETETGSMSGWTQRLAKLVERSFIRRCAVVSVVNEPIADWYEEAYSIARPVVVGNTPVVREGHQGLRDRLGIGSEPLLFVHTGHLVIGRNIPLILEAFAQSEHYVVFLGDGPFRRQVEEAGAANPNIHWLPPVDHDRIVANVREADVGLCLIDVHQALSDQLSSPNKLLESLAAGIPALCTDLVEARRLLGDLAEGWILGCPAAELGPALARITRADCERFSSAWPGLPLWSDEVAPLPAAIGRALARRRT